MGTGSFPGVKSSRSVTLTPHSLLVPWSRKSRAVPLLPLWTVRPVQGLSAYTRVHFTFYIHLWGEFCELETRNSIPVKGNNFFLSLFLYSCADRLGANIVACHICSANKATGTGGWTLMSVQCWAKCVQFYLHIPLCAFMTKCLRLFPETSLSFFLSRWRPVCMLCRKSDLGVEKYFRTWTKGTHPAAVRSVSQHVPSLLLKYGPHGSFRNLPEDTARDRCTLGV